MMRASRIGVRDAPDLHRQRDLLQMKAGRELAAHNHVAELDYTDPERDCETGSEWSMGIGITSAY
jgi:hypothetical protein